MARGALNYSTTPAAERDHGLNMFRARVDPQLDKAYAERKFDEPAKRALTAMAQLAMGGTGGTFVTRKQLKAATGQQKGWSRMMVALVLNQAYSPCLAV